MGLIWPTLVVKTKGPVEFQAKGCRIKSSVFIGFPKGTKLLTVTPRGTRSSWSSTNSYTSYLPNYTCQNRCDVLFSNIYIYIYIIYRYRDIEI